jgi:hypothetical protein
LILVKFFGRIPEFDFIFQGENWDVPEARYDSRSPVCSECQGRGECFLTDSDWNHKQETQQIHEAR